MKESKVTISISLSDSESVELFRAFEASKKRVKDKIKNREKRMDKILTYNTLFSNLADDIQLFFNKKYIPRYIRREDKFLFMCHQVRDLRLRLYRIERLQEKFYNEVIGKTIKGIEPSLIKKLKS
ncbi:MAG: hypothetical protein RBT05_09765 [Bacteroidales bacterium]|jgi:hypothetical protein|nr:hypothetical protein [Bacteroidales bacterium]